jgi:hypothetical protein
MQPLSRPCPDHGDRAAAEPMRWLSTHQTSVGVVIYYRCACGSVAVAVLADGRSQ